MDVVPGYEPLAEVFQTALDQSQKGKGKERHANDKPFLQQPIAEIGRMVGVGYNVGQAMKKGQESMRLPNDRAQAELLGAMVYLASAYLLIGERMEAEKRAELDIPNDAAHKAPSLCDSEVLDFSLPSIILEGDGEACRKKYNEELAEMRKETHASLEYLTEMWDVLQAVQTWNGRAPDEEDAKMEMIAIPDILQKHIREGNPVGKAKAAMLVKNALRSYYAPEVCKIILESNGERWR